MRKIYYFDLDGVLAAWDKKFAQVVPTVDINDFSNMPKAEKDALKQQFINYDYYRDLDTIERGMNMLEAAIAEVGIANVVICSATGTINAEDVARAKREWCAEKLPAGLEVFLVPKVENKPECIIDPAAENILIDDRERATRAWENAGYTAILFY